MLTNTLSAVRGRLSTLALCLAAYVTVYALIAADQASAAADSVTGIDYKTDMADPVLASAKPAVVAGISILVLLFAVKLAKKLWSKVSS